MRKITCDEAVRVLQRNRTAQTAAFVAAALGTSARAAATALRQATKDGRVTMRFTKSMRGVALYRFVRLQPRAQEMS